MAKHCHNICGVVPYLHTYILSMGWLPWFGSLYLVVVLVYGAHGKY